MKLSRRFPGIILLLFVVASTIAQDTSGISMAGRRGDSKLDPEFFDQLLGNYLTANKEVIVIGRSQKQLFAYFETTQAYRGLNKINDTTWSAGTTVVDDKPIVKYIFSQHTLSIIENGIEVKTQKTRLYDTEKIFFNNAAGIRLGGTIFKPIKPNGKAIVLLHGSGNQDRNGNNSCIRILADVLVRQGVTVLTYDKQGVGSSAGNYETMSFTGLAKDALSGIDYLRSRQGLNLVKIGLGGYSQVGWIIPRAIQQSNNVDFVLAINAAGTGITVEEQNVYDVKTQLACESKFSAAQKKDIELSQRYFFDYLVRHINGKRLDSLSVILKKDSLIKEWIYPDTKEIDPADKTQWYNVLDLGFNALPVWKKYQRPVLMLLSEFDDSTPATLVSANVKKLNNPNLSVRLMRNCQHLGLETNDVCNAKINKLHRFTPAFFEEIRIWMKRF